MTIPLRILFVEGSADRAREVALQLEQGGLSVEIHWVDTEADLVSTLDSNPDIVLSDYSASQFDSQRVLSIIKESGFDIPFILISGTADEDGGVNFIDPSGDDYAVKAGPAQLVSVIQYVSKQKRLLESGKGYRDIFENAAIAILDQDFSQVKVEVDRLRADGVNDFRGYVREHPEFLQQTVSLVKILDANKAALKLYGVKEKEKMLGGLDKFLSPGNFEEELVAFAEGRSYYEREIENWTIQGKLLDILIMITYYSDEAGRPKALVHLSDITERKQAEKALVSRERFLELLNDMTRAILLSNDFDTIFHTLAFNMKKIIEADDCYILRWDEEKQLPVPVTTTAKLEFSFAEAEVSQNDVAMIELVLQAGHALAVEDVFNSPYVDIGLAMQFPAQSIISIPLIVGEQKLGAAVIAFNKHHSFTREEVERTEQAGDQVALALWSFKQNTEIQQRLMESNALVTINRALSQFEHVGTGDVSQLIVDSARELIPHALQSVIHLLDANEQMLFPWAISGYNGQGSEQHGVKMHTGEGIAGSVINYGTTINIGDITAHPNFVAGNSDPAFRSLLVAPVQIGGQQIGTISVQSDKLNAFSSRDAQLLNALSTQAAIAIENTRLFESTQQRLKEVNVLYQISRGLAASLDPDQLIRDMVDLIHQNLGYYHLQIYLVDPETGNLNVRYGSGYIGNELVQQDHFTPAGEGIVGYVAEIGESFVTDNVDHVTFFKRNPLLPQTQSEIAIPIKISGQVVGVLDIQQTPPHRLMESDLQLMTAAADQLSVALQKASLYADLQAALQQEQTVRSQLIQSERLALVGRLLASVSHELNNPLQAIQNALFLLKDEKGLSDQAIQDLNIILSEAERMSTLIERLRSAYRPARIKDFQPVELNSLIEDVHALISTFMRQKEIVFEFHPDPALPDVLGVSDQLRQVALNLFLNAIEVMKPGGRLMITTRSLTQQKEVLLIISDSGPGIDPEILPRIFDPFITSKLTGTGIGLTITQDIIHQHHGRIEAANNPNGGATFSVWLPTEKRE